MNARARSRRRIDTPRAILDDARVIRVRVRHAADGFFDGAPGAPPWGKIELVRWLVEDYATACVSGAGRAPAGERAASSPIDGKTVTKLVEEARELVRTHAAGLARMGLRTPWLAPLFEQGVIVGLRDRREQPVFAPTAKPGLRLYERVLSLLVADFLNQRLAADAHEVMRFLSRRSGTFPRARPQVREDEGPPDCG